MNVVWEEGGPVQGRNQKGMWIPEQGLGGMRREEQSWNRQARVPGCGVVGSAQLWVSFSGAENGGMHQPLRSQCEFRRVDPAAVTLTWSSRKYPSAMLRGRCWDPAVGGGVGESCVDTGYSSQCVGE